MKKSKERNIISDKLVIEKTGKTLEDWFKQLDKKGAKKLSHLEIFNLVSGTVGLKPLGQWNQNLLTTTYEWNRKLKERGQKENGFEIGASKTISVPIQILFKAFSDVEIRKKWLKNKLKIRKSTLNKSLVITWEDEVSIVRVELYNKGENKSQVVVQHLKLPDSKMAGQMKEFWGSALNGLKTNLEK